MAIADIEDRLLSSIGDAGRERAMGVEPTGHKRTAVKVKNCALVASVDVLDTLGLQPFGAAQWETEDVPIR